MSKSDAISKRDALTGVAFLASVLSAVFLFYLVPTDYHYNHSGLALLITVPVIVLLVKVRTRNRHTKPLKLADLSNMVGLSSVVNFAAAAFALYFSIKSFAQILLDGTSTTALTYLVTQNPIVPAALLSSIIIWRFSDNKEAKKLTGWSFMIFVLGLGMIVLYELINAAPMLLR